MGTKILQILQNLQLQYESILVASAATKDNGQDYDNKHYSVNVMIHKNDPQIPQIMENMNAVILETFGGALPLGANNCLKDFAITDPTNTAIKDYYGLRVATKEIFARPSATLADLVSPALQNNINIGDNVHVQLQWDAHTTGSGSVGAYLRAVVMLETKGVLPLDAISTRQENSQIFAGMGQPAAMQPAAMQPAAMQPATIQPAAIQPAAMQPATIQPAAMQPATIQPVLTLMATQQGHTLESLRAVGHSDDVLRQSGYLV